MSSQRENYLRKWLCRVDNGIECDKAYPHSNDGFKVHVQAVHKLEWPRKGRTLYGTMIPAPPLVVTATAPASTPTEPEVSLQSDIELVNLVERSKSGGKAVLLVLIRLARQQGMDCTDLIRALLHESPGLSEVEESNLVEPARPTPRNRRVAKRAEK
ncbi:hypothetical protein AaE_009201 [Aphanomyces astaci]|uniref:Uncharacterized protein n=1 Tax=Aphanomyces astaci TaxID=112090 RepID=A0A6A5A8Z7_APHAT|nr:hypothetical protein AaE_009201 [Aphanomyces astaci]